MRASEFLTEANRNSVILIDFQPVYDSEQWGYRSAIRNAMQYLNQAQPTSITVFFNGADVGSEDTQHSVAEHFIEYDLDPDIIGNMKFIEKTYAFLRNWMDIGIDDALTIKVLRYMVMNHITDSRDIDDEVFEQLIADSPDYTRAQLNDRENMIYLPYEINISDLKRLNGSLIGGGGKDECLRELTLVMNAFNIRYKLVNEWIYG